MKFAVYLALPSGIVALTLLASPVCAAEKQELTVKIIDRQDHETRYTYFVPGYSSATANTNVNCFGTDSTVNCTGTTRATGTDVPAHSGSFDVRGATFSLQLPDGRVAVVNCDIKFAEHFAGRAGNHRDCRKPLINEIQVEFSGDKAKLKWPVSIDGKKIESETYKVLGILDKP
jgi:hypothetical protein